MTDPNPGTVHAMEEEMRSAGQGVFEAKSARAPANKARKAAPANKTLAADDELSEDLEAALDAKPAVSMSMTKAELLKAAKAEGVDVTADNNKAEIIEKVERTRKGK